MKIIDTKVIIDEIINIIATISCNINSACAKKLARAADAESNATAKFALNMMVENAEIAAATHTPVCQDTGMCIVFIDIGKDIYLDGTLLEKAVNQAVAVSFKPLRKSVTSALGRKNTGDNTPAVLHTRIVEGDEITLSVMLKGFGSENMSKLYMLTPADGIDGVKKVILDTAQSAGSNPCPPMILGVGIGGTMESAAIMSKRCLLRDVGSVNCNSELSALERELTATINAMGIGAQGFGGDTSCLAVFIDESPTHISSIPVAINILCHCQRSMTRVIK